MEELLKAVDKRHSVRRYTDKAIEGETLEKLNEKIKEINEKSGLNIQLVLNEPKAFGSFLTHYGTFSGVKNYIALIGKDDKDLDEKCGYYGEELVLFAQVLGLNTCWVALTYKKVKSAYVIGEGEKLCLVISLGYGETQGKEHKSKGISSVAKLKGDEPDWFFGGVRCALKAPTAINQQKFYFEYENGKVKLTMNTKICTKIDKGIVRYHFELGSGRGSDVFCD